MHVFIFVFWPDNLVRYILILLFWFKYYFIIYRHEPIDIQYGWESTTLINQLVIYLYMVSTSPTYCINFTLNFESSFYFLLLAKLNFFIQNCLSLLMKSIKITNLINTTCIIQPQLARSTCQHPLTSAQTSDDLKTSICTWFPLLLGSLAIAPLALIKPTSTIRFTSYIKEI